MPSSGHTDIHYLALNVNTSVLKSKNPESLIEQHDRYRSLRYKSHSKNNTGRKK